MNLHFVQGWLLQALKQTSTFIDLAIGFIKKVELVFGMFGLLRSGPADREEL